MKGRHVQNYLMLTRVVEFTANNASLFPKTSAAAEILAGLQSAVKEMSNQASAQVSSEGALRESRTARTAARESLTRRLVLTGHVAWAMNSDFFQMPARRRDHDLISTAHAFVENGASLSSEFSRHALPMTELAAAAEALERANADYSSAEARRASAIQEFGYTTMQAMRDLQRLDVIVEMTLLDNPAAIASWTVARAVTRPAARKREVQPAAALVPQAPLHALAA